MNSLVKMLKSSITKMVFIVAILVVALASSSCKHDKGGDKPMGKTEFVNLTFKYDAGVKKTEPSNIDVEKGRALKLSELKNKVKIEYNAEYEFDKFLAGGKDGIEIKDDGAYKPIVNTEIYVVSKKKSSNPDPQPCDVALTSIKIGPNEKNSKGIVPEDIGTIEIPVPTKFDGVEYDVVTTTSIEGATVTWDPPLENNKIRFEKIETEQDFSKEYTITVSKGGEKRVYAVDVRMMIHGAGFFGARVKGRDTSADLATIIKILNHEENVDLRLAGHEALIVFTSKTDEWKTVLLNGKDAKIDISGYKGTCSKFIPLSTAGEAIPIKVQVSNSEWDEEKNDFAEPWLAIEEFNFTITPSVDLADAFIEEVIVNDTSIADEKTNPDAFAVLFEEDEELAEFDSGKKANVAVVLSKKVKSVKINDIILNENQLEEIKNKGVIIGYRAKAENIPVNEDGQTPTKITIVVSPKAEDARYGDTTMKFNLVYKMPPKLYPNSFEINEKDWLDLPKDFKDAVKEGKSPLYVIDSNRLNMKFIFSEKPKEVKIKIGNVETSSTEVKEIKSTYTTKYEVQVSGIVNSSEQEVTLIFYPDNEGAFSNGEWKFKIKGSDTNPKVKPIFKRIGKEENLPKETFLDKLESSGAEFAVHGDKAEIFITLSDYEKNFLLDKILIDGVQPTDQEFSVYKGSYISLWNLKKTIEGLTSEGKDVVIKFEGKSGVADTLEWKFKLKSGGEKPKIPRSKIRLVVGRYGTLGFPFPVEFLEGLDNNTVPKIEIYGKDVKLTFTTLVKECLQKASFKIDDKDEHEIDATETTYSKKIEYTFEGVSKEVEHTIIARIFSKSEDYSPLEYKFKVKVLDDLPEPFSYIYAIDGKLKSRGYKGTLDKDFATLHFQTKQNIVKEVRMGKKDSLEEDDKVELKEGKDKYGKSFWYASKDIDLDTTDFEKWKIEVISNDESKYPKVTCSYELKGAPVSDANLAFEKTGDKPKVYAKMTRHQGMESQFTDEYGVTKVDFTAFTMSRKTKVKGIRVHKITGDDMAGDNAVDFASTDISREHTGTLQAYDDKPTIMKLWTTSQDESVKDDISGVFSININPVPLLWSYKKPTDTSTGEVAYDVIEVRKKKIKNNKVYMIFAPWKEDYGYKVELEQVEEKQEKFEKIGNLGQHQTMYRTSLDVTNMEADTEKSIKCVLTHIKTGKVALTYRVKVRMIE